MDYMNTKITIWAVVVIVFICFLLESLLSLFVCEDDRDLYVARHVGTAIVSFVGALVTVALWGWMT